MGSIAAGSHLPQVRLYATGCVDTGGCQACSGINRGTVQHRTWERRAMNRERGQGISKKIVDEARAALATEPERPLWSRGPMPRTMLPTLTPIAPGGMHWHRNGAGGIFTGQAYTDGSMRARWWWAESERAGWGVESWQPESSSHCRAQTNAYLGRNFTQRVSCSGWPPSLSQSTRTT